MTTSIVIGPNASMDARTAILAMALMAAVSLTIAGGFAALGLWPILPFAGLELAAPGTALVVVLRRNRYREVLWFEAETIRIEAGLVGQGALVTTALPRRSARVLLEPGENRHAPSRLVLSEGGRQVRVGRCVTDAERARLAKRLRELIHPGWKRNEEKLAPSAAWWG